jgi:hypothetical protein
MFILGKIILLWTLLRLIISTNNIMNSFSLSVGRPIALISGGQFDGMIIRVKTGEEGPCCRKHSMKCVRKACCHRCSCYDEDLGNMFSVDGTLSQVPNVNTREIIYVAGPSGSGKSSYVSSYVKNYKKVFPGNEVYIFSRKDSDPVFDTLGINRIIIDQSLVEEPIETKDLENSLVIFDDIDTVQDDKVKKAIYKLKDDILEIGRSMHIYCAVTSHLVNGNDRKTTRTILNELSTFTFFPKSGSLYQIKYCLKQYFGMNTKQIEMITRIPSRWITISKTYPQYIMHEHGVLFLPD